MLTAAAEDRRVGIGNARRAAKCTASVIWIFVGTVVSRIAVHVLESLGSSQYSIVIEILSPAYPVLTVTLTLPVRSGYAFQSGRL